MDQTHMAGGFFITEPPGKSMLLERLVAFNQNAGSLGKWKKKNDEDSA